MIIITMITVITVTYSHHMMAVLCFGHGQVMNRCIAKAHGRVPTGPSGSMVGEIHRIHGSFDHI